MSIMLSAVMVPKIPVYSTGNDTVDILVILWALFSGIFGLGMIKCIGTPWREISILNKLGLFSLILYFIYLCSCS